MNFEEVFNEAKKLNNNDVPSLGDVVETVFTYNKRIAKFFAIANVKELGDFDSDAIDEIRDVYNQGLNDDGVEDEDGNNFPSDLLKSNTYKEVLQKIKDLMDSGSYDITFEDTMSPEDAAVNTEKYNAARDKFNQQMNWPDVSKAFAWTNA